MAKFLVVDDSKTARLMASEAIKSLGHEVVGEAEDGMDGVLMYRELRPDFVIMDINMPGLDGISATKQILQEFKDAKILMVTSESSSETRNDVVGYGALEYLVKPVTIAELKDKVNRNL